MGEYMEHEKKLGKWQLGIFGEGVLWLPTISFHRPPKRLTRSLSLAEAPDPPSNPPRIIYYLDPQTGNSSWFSLCREAQRGQHQDSSHTAHGIKQCLRKFPFPSTPVTPLPSQLYNFNFYCDEALPAWKS